MDFETFEILKPLVLAKDIEPIVQLALDSADGTVRIRSRTDLDATAWTDHAKGRVSKIEVFDELEPLDLEALRQTLSVTVSHDDHYRVCQRRGMAYGPHFQGVKSIRMTAPDAMRRMALGEIAIAEDDLGAGVYRSHPAVFDACLQLLISLIAQNDPRDCATIPVQVGRIRSFGPLPAKVFCQVILTHENERTGVADMIITDAEGKVVMTMTEGRFQKVEFRASTLPILAEDWRPDPAWQVRGPHALAMPALTELLVWAETRLAELFPVISWERSPKSTVSLTSSSAPMLPRPSQPWSHPDVPSRLQPSCGTLKSILLSSILLPVLSPWLRQTAT